ncbi:MAG: hypothetical protein AAGL18_06090 [Pseudomonadota bacterium]
MSGIRFIEARQSPLIIVSRTASIASGPDPSDDFFAPFGLPFFLALGFDGFFFSGFVGVRGMVLDRVTILKMKQSQHSESRRLTGQGAIEFSYKKECKTS